MILQAQTIAQTLGDTAMSGTIITKLAESGTEKMNLLDMASRGGWIMLVLLALCILCFYIFIERIRVFKRAGSGDTHFMARIADYIKNGELKSAIIYCQATNTPLGHVMERGIGLIGRSRSDIQTGMENVGNIEISKLERGLSGMSTIASGAPMLGFLGTVIGMVRAFWEMSNAGNNIDVSLLSGGIYEAMITTVGGLIVGILAMFGYNYLVSRIDRLSNELEADILEFVEAASK